MAVRGTISIEGLDKADVLAALYNGARPQGLGFTEYDPAPMTKGEAEQMLERTTSFDYLKGRIVGVNLSGGSFNSLRYDYDNGKGAAQRIIDELRLTGKTNNVVAANIHDEGTIAMAERVKASLRRADFDGELSRELRPRVDQAERIARHSKVTRN